MKAANAPPQRASGALDAWCLVPQAGEGCRGLVKEPLVEGGTGRRYLGVWRWSYDVLWNVVWGLSSFMILFPCVLLLWGFKGEIAHGVP